MYQHYAELQLVQSCIWESTEPFSDKSPVKLLASDLFDIWSQSVGLDLDKLYDSLYKTIHKHNFNTCSYGKILDGWHEFNLILQGDLGAYTRHLQPVNFG